MKKQKQIDELKEQIEQMRERVEQLEAQRWSWYQTSTPCEPWPTVSPYTVPPYTTPYTLPYQDGTGWPPTTVSGSAAGWRLIYDGA